MSDRIACDEQDERSIGAPAGDAMTDDARRDGDAVVDRALQAQKAAFLQALYRQDEDFVRMVGERLHESRRLTARIEACENRTELAALKDEWAHSAGESCLVEARWLVLYADMIRHPDWLRRQVRAASGGLPSARRIS